MPLRTMGRRERQPGPAPEQQGCCHRNDELNRALHRSVFAHLTSLVPDPDHPGQWITYGERDLRLRGRAYRDAARS